MQDARTELGEVCLDVEVEALAVVDDTRGVHAPAQGADQCGWLLLDPGPRDVSRNGVGATPLAVAALPVAGEDVPRLAVEDRAGVLDLREPPGLPERTLSVVPRQLHGVMVTRLR